jgi:signal transduction histidine kinase
MTRLLRPFVDPATYRALAFYLATLALGIVGFVLLCAGWPVTICLAITPLVVPLLIGLRAGVGLLAQAEAGLARGLLRTDARPDRSTPGTGFWGRGFEVLKDGAFWRQQVHLLLSWPMALIPVAMLGLALQLVSLPIWYRWDEGDDVFAQNVDTFGEALLFFAGGLALLVVFVHLLGLWTRVSRWLASRLLAGDATRVTRSAAELRALRIRAVTIHAALSGATGSLLVLIWALTTRGYFWPIWPLLALGLVLGIHAWVVLVLERPGIARRTGGSQALAVHIGISLLLFAFLVGIWGASTPGEYFWPIWPLLGLTATVVAHAAAVFAHRERRIGALETSRAGAVNVQETELRRIERDLHDGAQARLVALGMSLGRAEQALDSDPEAVRVLLAEARHGAGEALEELRDLARGIRPPILTDRGLEPALAALTAHTPLPVTLSVDLRERPPAAVETAAYFTVAEALANAIKHAHAEHVDIRIQSQNGVVVAEIVDDGAGGADPSGRGLTGLRQRAEALDGTLQVTSPGGGPTTVRAVLPCKS